MNVEPFLRAIDGPAPHGLELRNEPDFQNLLRALEPASRSARTNSDGVVSTTSDVDWNEIVEAAEELAGKGRDLRLLVIVTRGWTNLEGFAGLAAGLSMMSEALETCWDALHPELRDRPDPQAASLPRKNAILQLENTSNGLLGDLEMGALIEPRGIGPVTGSDFALASLSEYKMLAEAPSGLGTQEIEALKAAHARRVQRVTTACRALNGETPEEAQTLIEGLAAAEEARGALEAAFSKASGLGNGTGLRLATLGEFLSRCRQTLDAALADEDAPTADAAMPGQSEDETMQDQSPEPAAAQSAAPTGGVGRIESRRDVERCLDQIIAFYERTEPSSPIPHLARRMRRMVPMDFVELMEEIAPSGMKEFKNVAGVDDKKKAEG